MTDREVSPTLSIIVPAYNEARNLPALYERLTRVFSGKQISWELVVVDDHSEDDTLSVIQNLVSEDPRVRAFRLSRNFGSHTAIMCGLDHAAGQAAVVLAADLQDPPEVILDLINQWKAGAEVVWAVRASREGERRSTLAFAKLYYFLMRRIVGIRQMPPSGSDFFLIDRRVIDAVCQFHETHTSLMALIAWLGFRQATLPYEKKARFHGSSGWSINKKFKLVWDSVTAFTYFPIRLMSYTGLAFALIGFIYALLVIANAMAGNPAKGWSSLMVVILVLGGMQMLMMGVLGEYLWRALDEAKKRPRYLIEARIQSPDRIMSPRPVDSERQPVV